MAYCTESEVFAAVKEDAYNSLLGEQYIEDVEERKNRRGSCCIEKAE